MNYGDIINGKKVCIAGNAASLNVDFLSAADLVVTCNKRLPHTDILYWDGSEIPEVKGLEAVFAYIFRDDSRKVGELCKKEGVPYQYYSPPPPKGHTDISHPMFWSAPLQAEVEHRPFTGAMAVFHALMFEPAEVWVTGMDFYRTPEGEFLQEVGPHKILLHIDWLYRTVISDSRLRIDRTLTGILSSYEKSAARATLEHKRAAPAE